MIRYALRCEDGHAFESWFASADAFDALSRQGMLTCGVCGAGGVEKALMAPKVSAGRDPDAADDAAEADPGRAVREKIAALRAKVEAEATYVGPRFAAEARALHEAGQDKPIYGEANAREAKALIEDGIAVAPLPFLPKAKAN